MSNWKLDKFTGKEVVFIGHGREGLSFEKFIKKHGQIAAFRFVDQKDGPDYLEKLKELDPSNTVVVKTAGCPGRLVPVAYTTPSQVFFELVGQTGATTVGVTGTKGKTTTSSLIAAMLGQTGKKVILCGNIGKPMLDYLDEATNQTIFVIELSSQQLDDVKISPNVGVATNIYNDHVDYHGSQVAYQEAKHNICRFMTADDCFVYSPAFPILQEWASQTAGKAIAIDGDEAIDMSKTGLIGVHNRMNAIMARTVATMMGASPEDCQQALNQFAPVRHRLQLVRQHSGLSYVDDAIGSQPEATIAGLRAVQTAIGPVGCLLLGGKDRQYDFSELIKEIAHQAIPCLILFPETGVLIKQALPASYKPKMFETSSMADAVQWAAQNAPKETVVLLSSAAPSYSLWKDFEEKGDLFQDAVNKLV